MSKHSYSECGYPHMMPQFRPGQPNTMKKAPLEYPYGIKQHGSKASVTSKQSMTVHKSKAQVSSQDIEG